MLDEPSETVQSFTFHAGVGEDRDTIGIEFHYVDGSSVILAYSFDELSTLDEELTDSILRCSARGDTEVSRPWPPRALQRPRVTGPDDVIGGLRVVGFSVFEESNDQAVLICFDHPNGDRTHAVLSPGGAQAFVAKIRDHVAFSA